MAKECPGLLPGHCFEPYPVQQGMAAPHASACQAEWGDAERRQQAAGTAYAAGEALTHATGVWGRGVAAGGG